MNVGCVIYYWGERYEKIGKIAIDSFKKFHPDVTVHHIDDKTREEYSSTRFVEEYGTGVHKYMLAYEIMVKYSYDRIIILGADTITCSRLDEFLDDKINNGVAWSVGTNGPPDVITTLDYPYQVSLPWCFDFPTRTHNKLMTPANTVVEIHSPIIVLNQENGDTRMSADKVEYLVRPEGAIEYLHVNADVVCFCNPKALKKVISTTIKYHNLFFGTNYGKKKIH